MLKIVAIAVLLLMPASAMAQSPYPENSVGRLLTGYGDEFRGGWVAGFLDAFFATGGKCQINVSPNMLLSAIKMNVNDKRVTLSERDQIGAARSLAGLGCTHPMGTKNVKGDT